MFGKDHSWRREIESRMERDVKKLRKLNKWENKPLKFRKHEMANYTTNPLLGSHLFGTLLIFHETPPTELLPMTRLSSPQVISWHHVDIFHISLLQSIMSQRSYTPVAQLSHIFEQHNLTAL